MNKEINRQINRKYAYFNFEREKKGELKLRQNFRNENQAGSAKISGIISDYAPFSFWPIFPLCPETVPEVFAKVNTG